jgi:hypothetical protein
VAVAKLQIADDIDGGSVEVRVTNPSVGTSNAMTLTIDQPVTGAAFVSGSNAGSSTGGVKQGGQADIEEYGHNLAGATDASWGGIGGLTFKNTQVQPFPVPGDPDLYKMTARVINDSYTSQTNDEDTNLTLTVNGVQSNPFGFAIFAPEKPHIDSLDPFDVVKDSIVWIKMKGGGFGTSPLVRTDASRAAPYLDPGDSSDPDHVKVIGIWFHNDAPDAVHLTIRNQVSFLTSDAITIAVLNPAANIPHVTNDALEYIHRGNTYNNVTFSGKNLQNPTKILAPQLQGLTFSNIKPIGTDGTSFSCTIKADSNATLSSDESTNLSLETDDGTGNPQTSNLFMLKVYPSPTPTPTP